MACSVVEVVEAVPQEPHSLSAASPSCGDSGALSDLGNGTGSHLTSGESAEDRENSDPDPSVYSGLELSMKDWVNEPDVVEAAFVLSGWCNSSSLDGFIDALDYSEGASDDGSDYSERASNDAAELSRIVS